ncbi:retinoblastoma-like protein 1 isoform X3 [Chrysoperla carnea]|uniref:retinoblastoma-like protein 1 isoform X3 n=1 Tax=Chrysoperla carnea TaxID=189513 RepID=UPI001D06412A|nr:retinoblastoma-like protein 1 isoform X3 [Chrysoperla carnea]
MGLLETDTENDVLRKHQELCRNLNLDSDSANQAWDSYESIRQNYTLEGDQLHWLGCALYVACRKVSKCLPTVGGQSETVVQGNGVNLTRLLRLCNLSLIQFFDKSKKWVNMANMPVEFSNEIERLERNFEVSTVIFEQYQLIFYDMFVNTSDDTTRPQRSRKPRSAPCTSSKVFEFCWTLFIYVKGENPEISADLVNSLHYLLACCDLMFGNAVVSDRRDLLQANFPGLPSDWTSSEYTPPIEPPCVMDALCKRHDAHVLDAKVIKNYSWKQHMKTLIGKKVLRADPTTFTGLLDQEVFDINLKSINKEYEAYVLNKGDFDERIFLEVDANVHIGSPARLIGTGTESAEQINTKKNKEENLVKQHLVPNTPYTGRCYLRGRRENPAGATLVTTATCSVSHLRTLLAGRTPNPSPELLAIFKKCDNNVKDEIETKLNEYGEMFCSKYTTNSNENSNNSRVDFTSQRLELARTLFYKLLEDIITDETRKKPDCNCKVLLSRDIFHHCLFAVSLEIVIFSYNSQRKFPWVLEALNLEPYYFYKIIEPIVSIKDHLSRDLVKHLNLIEEQVLQSMAWKNNSPVWQAIEDAASRTDDGLPVPTCGDCTIPPVSSVNNPLNNRTQLITQQAEQNENQNQRQVIVQASDKSNGNIVSPNTQLPSASERFQSPVTYMGKKRDSVGPTTPVSTTPRTIKPGQSLLQNQPKMYISIGGDTQRLIPVVIQSKIPPQQATSTPQNTDQKTELQPVVEQRKPKRNDSLALFFRKFYNLACVRMTALCNHLNLTNQELRLKIWTCFEYSIVHHIDLMKDRHLDQILMCAVYVVCKVAGTERTFTEVMRCYRLQPQASSYVYRSVLLQKRPIDTSNNTTQQNTNQQNQPHEPSAGQIAPLTPNQLSGTGTSFAHEDRGDLIKFYNTIYIQKIQNFAMRFSMQSNLLLSPLPTKTLTATPTRRVADTVFVRSLAKNTLNQSPSGEPLVYCFSRSPAKDLRAINEMINYSKLSRKRLLGDNDGIEDNHVNVIGGPSPPKQAGAIQRKIHGLFNDRLVQAKSKE